MSYKYVLGLDVSTHMGLAVTAVSGKSGFHTEQIDGKGTGMDRALQMVAILHERLKLFGPPSNFGFTVVEQPAYAAKGGAAHNVQNELNAIIRFSLHLKGIPAFTAAPNTIKKFATGNGNAKKPEMIAAARKLPGIRDTLTDNEADALFLAMFGLELVVPGSAYACGLGETSKAGADTSQLVKEWSGRNLKQLEATGLFT